MLVNAGVQCPLLIMVVSEDEFKVAQPCTLGLHDILCSVLGTARIACSTT